MNKKNVIITIVSVLILTCLFAFARTTTTDLELIQPTWSEEEDILDDINANSDILEAFANDPLEFDTGTRLEDRVDVVLSTWAGDTDIITLGTITTGVWQGTAIVDTYISDTLTVTGYMQDEDINTFSELQSWVTDKTLVNTADTATITANWIWTGTAASRIITINTYSDTATHRSKIRLGKSHQDTVGYTPTVNNEDIGSISAYGVGSDDDSFDEVARILFEQDGAAGAANIPGRIVFLTATNAAISSAALTLNSDKTATFVGAATAPAFVVNGTTAKGIDITGANTTAQLYIGGSNILANGEQAIYVNCPSEDGATNAMWLTLGSTVVTGDCTGARIKVTTNATTGGGAASGQNVRGVYAQAIVAASDDAGLLQGGLFVADVSAGSCVAYNVHVLCGHYSAGASAVIAGDLYVGYLRAQSRSTNARTVTGNDFCLALENEAVEGTGQVMDGAIRIFDTNVSGDAFTYGIDMNDAALTTDIRLSDAHTITDSATGILLSLLSPATISGLSNVTSEDADYMLVWDSTDSTLKKVDMGEVRGGGAGGGDVSVSGTPVDNQVAVWTDATTIEGTAGLTYSGTVLTISGDITIGANYIGRDVDNTVDFATDNHIIFKTSGATGMEVDSTGELDMNAHSVGFTLQTATGDGTTTIDWKLGNKFRFTFGAQNDTLTFTAPTNPGNFMLWVIQDGTGSRLMTWPTIRWAGGAAPTLSTAAGSVDIVAFTWDGTNWDGVASLAFATP